SRRPQTEPDLPRGLRSGNNWASRGGGSPCTQSRLWYGVSPGRSGTRDRRTRRHTGSGGDGFEGKTRTPRLRDLTSRLGRGTRSRDKNETVHSGRGTHESPIRVSLGLNNEEICRDGKPNVYPPSVMS
ncbi:Hypothetical predicted protein, partial [Marmota monax]